MASILETSESADPAVHPRSSYGLENHGIRASARELWNLAPAELIEEAVRRGEGALVACGPFNAVTAPHTGRSPDDRYIVREPASEAEVDWGKVNRAFDGDRYEQLRKEVVAHLGRSDLFVRDMWGGADPAHRLPVRTVTTSAWHNLFAYNMFREPDVAVLEDFRPGFTVLHAPDFKASPGRHGTRSNAFVILHFGRREVLIGGTRYAGEIKKSIFSVLNFLLPRAGVLPMHCSANQGEAGDTALFFGLSGTGKTTLSADPDRRLIGDDEHGWTDEGVFNFEGGCYAKIIRLSAEGEPEIYATTRMFGTILENVVLDDDRTVRFDDDTITENTRASYPLAYIPRHVESGRGGHPRNVVYLAADAYGVLPPVSKLSQAQAMYHFLSGYTAKVAGTERGVTEPKATFSACFGAPFMVRSPSSYAEMLGERLAGHDVTAWLVNTGWTGGPYGEGSRIALEHTRAIVRALLRGDLTDVPLREDPVFGVRVPERVPDVPEELLDPRGTWADAGAYDAQARKLAEKVITKGRGGSLHERRLAQSLLTDKDAVGKLFDELGPRYADRPGGYTRMLKLGPRKGDASPMVLLELV
jgi:phosphoenolpyruvate carboxykinase (ATP)